VFSNAIGEKTLVGYDSKTAKYYIDRSHSGKVDFAKSFNSYVTSPRISHAAEITMEVYVDAASVELFADGGLSVMTAIVFPAKPYDNITIQSNGKQLIKSLSVSALKSIWKWSSATLL
jgi:fructan beta-fructosidase